MQFGVLGPLEVRTPGGELVSVGGPRPRAMLTVLLLNAGAVVSIERIVALQYGDEPPPGVANAVQAHVSRLRRSLPAVPIERTGGGYRIGVARQDVDVHCFESLAGEGARALAGGEPDRAARLFREALALWRGPALVDLPVGAPEAVRLEELRLSVTEDLLEASPGSFSIADLRKLVSEYPYRERLRAPLMRALHATGRPGEALAEFDEVRRLLADELGSDPSAGLAAVHVELLRSAESTVGADAMVPASAAAFGRPAPTAQLTSFVGRESEMERLAGLRDAHLITVVGPGGTGKTRLAIEFAKLRAPEWDVCFVDLSAVDDDHRLPHAMLGSLGLRESGFSAHAADPVRRLCQFVAGLDRRLLLILDNCEQIVDAVAILVRSLVEHGPRLSVLATSREPLGLTGETLLPLLPLAIRPAVRLFTDRARAVRPDFEATDTVDTVRQVCASLDGLPLAIELAAVRLRQFTVHEIRRRLGEDGHFRLLSRGDRTAAARHRTLHAVVAWSWALLGADEQVLARRLAVFRGGASIAAIEAVCDGSEEILADLVDKSFIECDGERYRMLETIRLFCLERLAESGEQDALRRSHARYLLGFARAADPHLLRAEQLEWLVRLRADHDNLIAALRWSARHDRPTALGLVAALAAYWWLSGRRDEVGELAAELLATPIEEGFEEEYISCVVHAVPRPADEHWTRAADLMRGLDYRLRHSFGLAMWGVAVGPSDETPVMADIEQRLGGSSWTRTLVRLGDALLELLGGRPDDAARALSEVLGSFRDIGERWGIAQALDWLGVLAGWRGDWPQAHELWAESLALLDRLGAVQESADVLCHRADCLIRQGDLDAAGATYRLAAELGTDAGEWHVEPDVLLGLGTIARLRGAADEAAGLFDLARAAAEAGGSATVAARSRAQSGLALVAGAGGDLPGARRLHAEALALARGAPSSVLADAAEARATTALASGDGDLAARLLGAAAALRGGVLVGDVDVARTTAAASDLLGPAAFAEAHALGRAHALTVLDDLP